MVRVDHGLQLGPFQFAIGGKSYKIRHWATLGRLIESEHAGWVVDKDQSNNLFAHSANL